MYCAEDKYHNLNSLKNKVYVYEYNDPKSHKVVYIGKGTGYRAWYHLTNSHNQILYRLINKRTKEGYKILPRIIKFFDYKDDNKALDLEKCLIKKYGRKDIKTGTLFNHTDGGDGALGVSISPVEFRGIIYPNRTALCRKYNIDESVVRTRLKLNWSLAEALNVINREKKAGPKKVLSENLSFDSITAFAKHVGKGEATVRRQLDSGFTPDEILQDEVTRKGTAIKCKLGTFVSKQLFADKIGKSIKAINYWLETGWTPDEIIEDKVKNRGAKYVYFNEQEMTMSAFSKLCNISHTSLIKYIKSNFSLEDIFLSGQRPLSEKLNGKTIIANGNTYSTISEFNKSCLNMSMSTLHKWLYTFGFSGDDCIVLNDKAIQLINQNGLSKKAALSKVSLQFRNKTI